MEVGKCKKALLVEQIDLVEISEFRSTKSSRENMGYGQFFEYILLDAQFLQLVGFSWLLLLHTSLLPCALQLLAYS